MTTVALAKKKWARKVKGTAWKSGVSGKGPTYCKGVADFLGISTCNPARESAFTAGTGAVTAGDFDSAVAGKEEKWIRKYKEKMAG